MIGCITVLSFGVKKHEEGYVDMDTAYQRTGASSAFWSVFFACLCPFAFAFGGVLIRTMNRKFHVNPTEFTQAFFIVQSVVFLIGCILAYTYDDYTFNIWDFLQIVLAGILSGIGKVLLSKAITVGYAGVVYSLVNLEVIFLIILDVVFLFQIPNWIEISAAALGIIGS